MARDLTGYQRPPQTSSTDNLRTQDASYARDRDSDIISDDESIQHLGTRPAQNPFEVQSLDSRYLAGAGGSATNLQQESYENLLPATSNSALPRPSTANSPYMVDSQNSSYVDDYSNNFSSTERDSNYLSVTDQRYPRTASGVSAGSISRSSFMSGSSVNSGYSNPFVADTDFSPFGGYPASSFPLHIDDKEDDDYLHNPDPIADADMDRSCPMPKLSEMDRRGKAGLAAFICVAIGAIMLMIVLPALTYSGVTQSHTGETYEILSDYTYPLLSGIRTSLIDPDTPDSAKSRQAMSGDYWKLVFSDEFNAEGRTFYEGDDQFWLGPDVHYAATNDLEWYSPDASTTANGSLQLRLDAFENHDLFYRSGMLQSWNKLCFTQGVMEVSAQLPNLGNISGLWPGLWTMGNLGRPGYKASTDGVWPYTYESCDAGATANQSSPDGISYLPGQKLNACTCDGEEHPNQGTGRGAPEIDALEGAIDTTLGVGTASQSSQIAPYDIWYMPDYNFVEIHNKTTTTMNTYAGGPFQQAVSAVTTLNDSWFENYEPIANRRFQKYAIEMMSDNDDGYVRWFVGETPTWTLHAKALHPEGNIGWRRMPKEPMSIILNLGISNNWAYINWLGIAWPSTMKIDYVRIYQPNDSVSITCDPTDYPTYDYINDHPKAYKNVNLTTWADTDYGWPKNSILGQC